MKVLIFICLVISATLEAHIMKLSQAQQEKSQQYTVECIQISGVKLEVVSEAKQGKLINDEALKKFILCFFQKAAILTSDAKLNIDVAVAKLPPSVDKVMARKVMNDCKNKTGKDNPDTAFEITKCYLKNMKQKFFFDA